MGLFTRQFPRIFCWHCLRDAKRHPLLAALNISAIALGVAVFLAIQLTTRSADRAFSAGIDVVAGKSDLELNSATHRLDETVLPKLWANPEIEAATPTIRGTLVLPGHHDSIDLIGMDLFTSGPFSTFAASNEGDYASWLATPNAIGIPRSLADRWGLKIGDKLEGRINSREVQLPIVALLDLETSLAGAHSHFAVTDIGWAQELLNREGYVSSIQIKLRHPEKQKESLGSLASLVPEGATLAPPAQRGTQIRKMLSGFTLNLTALSMISLLVGMFLIYNTVAAVGVRRRTEIGILKSLGVSRAEILALFLGETLLAGIIGTALGIVGGIFLANSLVGTVATTISSLYVLVHIEQAGLGWAPAIYAMIFGIGSVLVAAFLPAWEAANSDPIESLHPGHAMSPEHSGHLRCGSYAVACFMLAVLCAYGALHGLAWLGFGCAFFVLVGFGFTMPSWITVFAGCLRLFRKRSPILVTLAAQNLVRGVRRSSVMAAALMAAAAMTVGISIMIHAFRTTVDGWVEYTVRADLFVSSASTLHDDFIPPALIDFLRSEPSVDYIEPFREIETQFRGEPVFLGAMGGIRGRQLQYVDGERSELTPKLLNPETVAVSESFAQRFNLKRGDQIELQTQHGSRPFQIIGIFYDYTRDRGAMLMTRQNFDLYWDAPEFINVAIYLRDASRISELEQTIRQQFSPSGQLSVFSNRSLRDRIFEIFDQTFAVTYVLRTIALIVACLGIFLTFTIAVTERKRELALLRSSGASRLQLGGLIVTECAFSGLLAGIAGSLAGIVLAYVLTYVINKAFFGWTIQFHVPWSVVFATPIWMVAASMLAGITPAWRASHSRISDALRSE